jgi:hypothetical protein
MRKLVLATAIMLLSSSAFAGGLTRGLSSPQSAEPQQRYQQAEVTVLPAPGEQVTASTPGSAPQTVEQKLKAVGEIKSDPTPAAKPVEAKATEAQPVKRRATTKRETDEQKARRIAGRYGISW